MLCDRLVCSVNQNLIQQKLLSEGLPLTLKKNIKHCYISWISNQPVIIIKPESTASTSQQGGTNKYIQNKQQKVNQINHVIAVMVVTNQKHAHLKTRGASAAKLRAIQSRYVEKN